MSEASGPRRPVGLADAPRFRQILRSTSIIGGSSAINVTLGIVRTKVLAVLLGPTGVGLMGMYSAVLSTASTVAGMGLGNSGTRQIAAAVGRGDRQSVADARAALWRATAVLGILGGLALAFAAPAVSRLTFGDLSQTAAIRLLGLAVAASVVTGSQTALLTGLRRIGDVARVNVLGGAVSTALAVGIILAFKERGILPLVVAVPFGTLAVATIFAARAGRRELPPSGAWRGEAGAMLKIGVAVMAAGLCSTVTLLVVRSILVQRMGLEANGQFQAAWGLSMTYLGFVLSAMGTDFYPRLAGVMGNPEEASRTVNDQAEVALLIAGPIILAMTALAPLLVSLFYSPSFAEAIPVLRWQMLGNVLKVATWPLGFVFLARGASGTFFLVELVWNVIFLGVSLALLGSTGLVATGYAFLAGYAVNFVVFPFICHSQIGFRWRPGVLAVAVASLGLTGGVLTMEYLAPTAAQWTGAALAAVFGAYSLRRLATASGLDGNSVVASVRRHLPWGR